MTAPGQAWPSLLALLPLAVPLAWLLACVAFTYVSSRAARRAADAEAAWRRLERGQERLRPALWLGWLLLVPLCGANAPVLAALSGLPRPLLLCGDAAFFALPPAAAVSACRLLCRPAYDRTRGPRWTALEQLWQNLGDRLYWLAPVLLGAAALGAVLEGEYRAAVLLLLGAVAGRSAAGRLSAWAWQWSFRSLSRGELYERACALAERAGVALGVLFVIPSGKSGLANAFALPGEAVVLTDRLLANLSRRETDAVILHELAHLRRKHNTPAERPPLWTELTRFGGGLLGLGLLVYAWAADRDVPDPLRWAPALLAGWWLGSLLHESGRSRACEREADADTVDVGGDPEAFLTALARLEQMDGGSLDESARYSLLDSHPPTARRIEAVAARGGVAPERVCQLLAEAAGAPEDGYPLPPEAGGEEPVRARGWRDEVAEWVFFAAGLVPVALAAWLFAGAEGESRWGLALAAAGAGLALQLAVVGRTAVAGDGRLRERLRDRLAREGFGPWAEGGAFVRFAPGEALQFHDGESAWDVGFLSLAGDRLVYVGERLRFGLSRGQVLSVRQGRGMPHWWPVPRLMVDWRDSATGQEGTFAVWPGCLGFSWRQAAATGRLSERVRHWLAGHDTGTVGPAAPPPGLPPAGVGGLPAAEAYRLRGILTGALKGALLAGALAYAAGLPLDWSAPGSAVYVAAVAAVQAVLWYAPAWIYPPH